MRRRRATEPTTPAYPSAGEVLNNRREFMGMIAKIMAGAAMMGPVAALARAPDDPEPEFQGQAPVVPEEFPVVKGDMPVPEPPRTRGVVKPPDPPVTGGVPMPPDPPDGDTPPKVGCDPDAPPPTGGVVPMPDPIMLDGEIPQPEEPRK